MPEISRTHMGGTMRLGLRPTVFEPDTESWSRARMLYGGAGKIWERHRHRYEVNPEYVKQLSDSGLMFSGKDEKGERMQILELRGAFFFLFLSSPHFPLMLNHFSSTSRPPIPLALALSCLYSFFQITLSSWACRHIPSSALAHSTHHPLSSASSLHRQREPFLLSSWNIRKQIFSHLTRQMRWSVRRS
jgi:hypothetical protein